jgi:cell division protein ZapB
MQDMQSELDRIDKKITEVVSLCEVLKTENAQLKRQLAAAEKSRSALSERMAFARMRLEQLALQLPEDMQLEV